MPRSLASISVGLQRALLVIALVLTAIVAFGPARHSPFDFDDVAAIPDNATITHLLPPDALIRWPDGGTAASGRPVSNLSLAADYAVTTRFYDIDRLTPQSPTAAFHYTNIAIHIVAALLLAAIVASTLRWSTPPISASRASLLGAATAMLWLAHPLNAEAVDYIAQRTELLAGMFALASVWCAANALHVRGKPARTWVIGAVVACWLAAASKEMAAVVPILIALYDLTFVHRAGDERERPARRALYAGLCSSWILLAILVLSGGRGGTVTAAGATSPFRYALTQTWATTHYLQLFLFPDRQRFDYGTTAIADGSFVPFAVVALLLIVAVCALWTRRRYRWLAFCATWWLLCLAPSSSIVPIQTEIAAERRAYLASAGLAVALVLAIDAGVRYVDEPRHTTRWQAWRTLAVRLSPIAFIALVLAGVQAHPTFAGTLAFADVHMHGIVSVAVAFALTALLVALLLPIASTRIVAAAIMLAAATWRTSALSRIYADVVAKWSGEWTDAPDNPRAMENLVGAILRFHPENIATAESLSTDARRRFPASIGLQLQGADVALATNNSARADSALDAILAVAPNNLPATERKGKLLLFTGRPTAAIPFLTAVARTRPTAESVGLEGLALLMSKRNDDAARVLADAVRLDPSRTDNQRYLGAALVEADRGADAVPHLELAVAARPDASARGLLSLALAQAGRADSAAALAASIVADTRADFGALMLAGRSFAELHRYADASEAFEGAVRLNPRDTRALDQLAASSEALGFKDNAIRFYEAALRVDPSDSAASVGLRRMRGSR